MMSHQSRRATLLALAAVACWSTVATAFKLTLRIVDPGSLLFIAAPVSTLVLGLALFTRRTPLRSLLDLQGLARSALAGFLNPFLYYLILFEAYDRLPGQEAQPLNYTWAIALTLLSVLMLRQRIRIASWLGIFVSFFGVLLLSTRGDLLGLRFGDPLGVGLALSSSVIWALYWILNMKDSRAPVEKLFLGFFFGTIYVGVYAWLKGFAMMPPLAGLVGGIYVGVFEMGITFLFWLAALEASENTARISNLIFLSPFVSLLLLHFVAGEEILVSSILGLVFIVVGIGIGRRWG
jgi:drug/metabolite transporter (DMT)-like permease